MVNQAALNRYYDEPGLRRIDARTVPKHPVRLHAYGEADLDIELGVSWEETERPRFEGNRKARRKAAAEARKQILVMPPERPPEPPKLP